MLLLTAMSAWACGGLFCDAIQPVEQAGERIVFAVDEQQGTTTMHVEITYEGPSAEFAWVLPVRGVPELEISSKDLFDVLNTATAPRVGTSTRLGEQCDLPPMADSDDSFTDTGAEQDPSVQLLATEAVGPYETATLAATDADALVTWLQDNGYAVPAQLAEALAPYIGTDMNFVALRLAKDNDAGDLRPLALTYDDRTPSIPLVLTRVAAQDDMPITVYVLGQARAVPDNYLHVQLNPLHLDYWTFGSNYDDVIDRAADEAGGQAFATDLSDTTSLLANDFYAPGTLDTSGLGSAADASAFVLDLWQRGFPASEDLVDVLREVFPLTALPDGVEDTDAYGCPSCYPSAWNGITYDGAVAEAAVQGFVDQREATQEMVDARPWITRLRSSVSAAEMTLDPTFAFNADMEQQVSNQWVVTVTQECGSNGSTSDAPQHLELPGGIEIDAPSANELGAMGMTLHEWLVSNTGGAAMVIEDTSSDALPTVIVDIRNDLGIPVTEASQRGCGCTAAGRTGSTFAALVLAGALFRRRSP